MAELRIVIDVNDLERAIAFYTQALELRVARRLEGAWAELTGAPSPIDLVAKEPGSKANEGSAALRDYARHWTPVHLDFAVADLDTAMTRALAAGARLEGAVVEHACARMAIFADPFGHGFCLLQFRGRGYDEIPGVTRG